MSLLATTLSSSVDAARLVTTSQLRRLALAVRHDVEQYDPPPEPDEELLAAVAEPYSSVDDAYDRLVGLERLLQDRSDRRAVFLTIYTRMTRQIRERVDSGGFEDPEWMREYTTTFANYYRRAFRAFERGEVGAVPDPWRIAFGTALRGDALVMQDAFLGINAHINYDLALALRDVGLDPDRSAKRADHRAVNEVLAGLIDTQQSALAEVYAPGVADIDAVFGRLDEHLSLLALTEGREQAWRVAVVLADFGWSPVVSFTRWVLRTTATGGAHFLLGSVFDPELADQLRRFEREGTTFDEVLVTLQTRLDDAG
ncbi:MAG: hypothetical protein ACI8XM_001538 [Haloarculaceae archaeon]|jgi:hypothetical protein